MILEMVNFKLANKCDDDEIAEPSSMKDACHV